MKEKRYNTFEEWYKDYKLFRANPNDKDLMVSVALKLDNSTKKIREEIVSFVETEAMLDKPVMILKQIQKRKPGSVVVINSEKDPWFAC